MMIVISNENLRVEIAEFGAEIRRVTFCGKERFWNGDSQYWTGVSPILFPICSCLPDGKYTFDGKEYNMSKHGFARKSMSTVESVSQDKATFLFTDTPETLEKYPWKFELRVTYTLDGNNIKTDYDVKNLSENDMYYSIGAHEAYLCKDGIEEYDIIFENEETLYSYRLDGEWLSDNKVPIIENSKVLPLKEKYFEDDALIFKDVKSRFVTLQNRNTKETVSVEFPGFDYLLLWHVPNAPYMCIEPWAGITSPVGWDYDITKKEGIMKLAPNENKVLSHTIYF